MKITFIIEFNRSAFGGVFFASTTNIKFFTQENKDFEVHVFNVRAKPPAIIRTIRNLIKRERFYSEISVFNHLTVRNIFYSINFIEYFRHMFFKNYDINYEEKMTQLTSYFEDTDLIVAHYGNGPGEMALHLSKLLQKKFAVIFHGSDIHTSPFLTKKRFLLCKEILQTSSANIFVSNGLMQKSLTIYDASEQNHVLYNGIDFNLFKKQSDTEIKKNKKHLNLKDKVVGYVGNLIDVKNVMALPEIFSLVKKKNTGQVSFVIIGDGILKKQLKESFEKLSINVKFLGQIPNDQLPVYFSLMNVLVLPSKNEGMGLVIIEAKACGVHCVGSKVGGIPELLPEENYFDLNKKFEEKFAERVSELLFEENPPDINQNLFDLNKLTREQGDIFRKIIHF